MLDREFETMGSWLWLQVQPQWLPGCQS